MTGMEPAIFSAVMGAASMAQGAQQASSARKRQAAALAQQQREATLRQRIEERRIERERRSQEASARARLGAAGVGSTGGSGAAVIQGLNSTYDTALRDSREVFDMSIQGGANLLDDGSRFGDALKLTKQAVGLGQQVYGIINN